MNKYHFINIFNDGEAHISKKCIKIKKYQKNKKINLRYVNSIMHIDVKINKTANVLCFNSFSFFFFFYFCEIELCNMNVIVGLITMKNEHESIFFSSTLSCLFLTQFY